MTTPLSGLSKADLLLSFISRRGPEVEQRQVAS
jgi:hypothetical protein